jgi:hypothetical protein
MFEHSKTLERTRQRGSIKGTLLKIRNLKIRVLKTLKAAGQGKGKPIALQQPRKPCEKRHYQGQPYWSVTAKP